MKDSIFPEAFIKHTVEEYLSLAVFYSFWVVASILRVLGFGLVNTKTFHGILLELSFVNITVWKQHHSLSLHFVTDEISLVLATVCKAVSA